MSSAITWIPFNGLFNAALPLDEENALLDKFMAEVVAENPLDPRGAFDEKVRQILDPKLAQSFFRQGLAKPGTVARLRFSSGHEGLYVFGGHVGDRNLRGADSPGNYTTVIEYAVLF